MPRKTGVVQPALNKWSDTRNVMQYRFEKIILAVANITLWFPIIPPK